MRKDEALIFVTAVLFAVMIAFNGWANERLDGMDRRIAEIKQELTEMEAEPKPVIEAVPLAAEIEKEPEPEMVSLGKFTITAYSACYECCGKHPDDPDYGITASGTTVQEGRTIAADWKVLQPGTVVYIEGIGRRIVEDKGGAIKWNKLDVFFSEYQDAVEFGKQEREVWIIED